MRTRCERHGQVEIGIVEHQGREFSALGASVFGAEITGYTKLEHGEISLTSWCGKPMLDARHNVVESYPDGSLSLMFRLPRQRFIVGYALGSQGMLFRGELVTNCDDDEARRTARSLADFWAEQDAADDDADWE